MMLRIDDLINISTYMKEQGYSNENLELRITLETNELLNKLNEEIFYYYNKDTNEIPDIVEEVNVNVMGTKFKFITE